MVCMYSENITVTLMRLFASLLFLISDLEKKSTDAIMTLEMD